MFTTNWPSVAVLLVVSAALATPSPPACPGAATAAPNTTWGGACFSLTKQRASSLRQCVERCGEQGMTPACIGSAEENAFAAGLVPANDWAYIGHYQNNTSGGPAEGWGRCVAAEASGFAFVYACTTQPRVVRFFESHGFRVVDPGEIPAEKWTGYPRDRRAAVTCLRRDL